MGERLPFPEPALECYAIPDVWYLIHVQHLGWTKGIKKGSYQTGFTWFPEQLDSAFPRGWHFNQLDVTHIMPLPPLPVEQTPAG